MTFEIIHTDTASPGNHRIRIKCDVPGCQRELNISAGPYPSLKAFGDAIENSGWDVNGTTCSEHRSVTDMD